MISMQDFLADLRYSLRHPGVKIGLLVCAILLGITLLTVAAYWYPLSHSAVELTRNIEAKRKQLVNALYAADITQAYSLAHEQAQVFEKRLHYSGSQADLVRNLSQLAKKSGVIISSESYEEGAAQDGFVPLFQEVSLRGRYPDLRRFIASLQELATWTYIDEAVFEKPSERTSEVKLHLRLITYRKGLAEEAR